MKTLFRFFLIGSIGVFVMACGQTTAEKTNDAILAAEIHLTKRRCDEAISILEGIGRQNTNATYLQTLSSAYACKAGFDEPTFYGTNMPKIGNAADKLLGSLTTFQGVRITAPLDTEEAAVQLQKAIDILLYAGGVTSPSHTNRSYYFSQEDMGNINTQLLYMILTQLGKFVFYYGNANPTAGTKGTGNVANGNSNNNINTCFYRYSNAKVKIFLAAGETGACTDVNIDSNGHPTLVGVANAIKVKRMCHGVVLFNNLIDVLLNTVISTSAGSLSTIGAGIQGAVTAACAAAIALPEAPAGVAGLCSIKSQGDCEVNYENDLTSLEYFYASVFETLFK